MKIVLLSLTFFLLLPIPVQAAEILNNSFENNTDNWTKTTSTVEFMTNTSDIKESTHSAEITFTSSTSNGIKQTIAPILAGQTYKISSYIKNINAKKAYIRIAWYQEGTTSQLKTDDSPIVTATDEWSLVEFTATAPPQSTSAEIRLLVSEGTALFDTIAIAEYIAPTSLSMPTNTPTLTPTSFPHLSPTITISESLTNTPSINYQNILISEAFVYPESGSNEWVELYNANAYTVYLNNWYIDDITDGGAIPKVITITLLPNSYVVIEMTTSIFNNTGDTIQLLDSAKMTKDSITYTGSQMNKSIGRTLFSSNTVCIQNPSKATINEACISLNEDTNTISPSPTFTPTLSPPSTPTITYHPKILGTYNKLKKTNHLPQKSTHSYVYSNTEKELHKETIKEGHKAIPLLATAYSLLSFLSITAKMIIVRH